MKWVRRGKLESQAEQKKLKKKKKEGLTENEGRKNKLKEAKDLKE